jgi:hypothetical protein
MKALVLPRSLPLAKRPNLPRAALRRPPGVPALISLGRSVVASIKDNPFFPQPTPAIVKVEAAVDALDKATTAALGMTSKFAAARAPARNALVSILKRLMAYVQGVADDADPDHAVTIIESSGFALHRNTTPRMRGFRANPGRVSGTALLIAAALAKRARYDWQWSDDGGRTWHDLPSTLQAKTSVSGLTAGKRYWFRFRGLVNKAWTDWSAPASIIVT